MFLTFKVMWFLVSKIGLSQCPNWGPGGRELGLSPLPPLYLMLSFPASMNTRGKKIAGYMWFVGFGTGVLCKLYRLCMYTHGT